ncbi:pirin family protein [Pseudomarimonas arenosa]|uniref:pirin family protein n=1 Tax=Pseudomarimonas arenosa TaxID=2774145 RepID=UPI002FC32A22
MEHVIVPPVRDLGDGFKVRRALPSALKRMVGPFVFLDHFGPVSFGPDQQGMQVRPHPHIGLSTLTYLRAGQIMHRDSLGNEQLIRAGDVNWMTAGRGIVHSERSPPAVQANGGELFGQQIWVALPIQHEEIEPSFCHHRADSLPSAEEAGVQLTVVAGQAFGLRSPVRTYSDLMCVNLVMPAGSRFQLPTEHVERAALLVRGEVRVEDESARFDQGQLIVFRPGANIVLRAEQAAVLLLVGGEPLPERRHIYWNFVSSSQDRIAQAKDDWREGRFEGIEGDSEFIPLPKESA